MYLLIAATAFGTSLLTFFSGFGLGTLLMPVFAIFFPVNLAIGLTAIVHFLNNLFKLFLLGKHANKEIVLKFGFSAIAAAFMGAQCLTWFSRIKPILVYHISGRMFEITPLKLMIAVLMILFAAIEILPTFKNLKFDKRYLPIGGILSGFFGGLSGHQGGLRSAFLLKCGLSKESFIGTGVVVAVMVDITRLLIYRSQLKSAISEGYTLLLVLATLSAFAGAWLGNRFLKKATFTFIQVTVSILLFFIAAALGAGII